MSYMRSRNIVLCVCGRITVGLIYIGCMIYVIVNIVIIGRQTYNLVSLSGIVVYVFLFYLFSYSPQHVLIS
jgi:hypothetical protein